MIMNKDKNHNQNNSINKYYDNVTGATDSWSKPVIKTASKIGSFKLFHKLLPSILFTSPHTI